LALCRLDVVRNVLLDQDPTKAVLRKLRLVVTGQRLRLPPVAES
jgi:hypothetical protein